MANLHDKFAVAMIKDSQIEGQTLLENLFHTNYVVFCYIKSSVVHCPSSVILLGEGGKEKA